MKLLAIDTSARFCSASVLDIETAVETGRSVSDIGKGHAELLMATIEAATRQAGTDLAALGAIAVSVGPGSFTGIRVGVSAARGFALALHVPAIGLTTLEALAAEAREALGALPVLVILDGGRDEMHVACFGPVGETIVAPGVMTLAEAAELARGLRPVLAGSASARLAAEQGLDDLAIAGSGATADIAVYGRLALGRLGTPGPKPKPLYLRGADAKPQAGFILARQER
jgi:tRNA threonylcarbamoyladenosine biosynthesis protein TsaB